MDKKKTLMPAMALSRMLLLCVCLACSLALSAQSVSKVEFCGTDYVYVPGSDSITLFLKVTGPDGQRADVQAADLREHLHIYEDGKEISPALSFFTAQRGIPRDYTFSVLVDQGISPEGKSLIYQSIQDLVESAPDSCVYLSFFGDEVSASRLVTRQNLSDFSEQFNRSVSRKFFFSALYAKLLEMAGNTDTGNLSALAPDYRLNEAISRRVREHSGKNFLFVFADGRGEPDGSDIIRYTHVTDYQADISHAAPRVFAFYYTPGGSINDFIATTLAGVTGAEVPDFPEDRKGSYMPSRNIEEIMATLSEKVDEQMYDFAFIYKATAEKYQGGVTYTAKWDDMQLDANQTYSIGTPENPWPLRPGNWLSYLWALVIALLTIAFFFLVMKVLIPYSKSKSFSMKYYKSYVPEANVQKRVCHYCKQPILPGQLVVTKCIHVMHVNCWQQNGYQCGEYGQNCKTGIQEHVDWGSLLTWPSVRDCRLTIAGICAGLVSWIVYELTGRGAVMNKLSTAVVDMFLTTSDQQLQALSVTKVSAFMMMGLFLGFFLSLVFRYYDEYRKKSAGIYLKIVGLSLLSGLIGMLSFAFGGIIFCMLLSAVETSYIPWYCSLPAYMFFSVCTSLSLTIKSTIPVKSAMLGGLCSSAIGFLVLYLFDKAEMNMLLNFIIYGGGLGASLVTVRMLAEKYFLVIMNGAKAGTRIPIHKWMNATGGGNKVTIGMTGDCEIQMNWDKSNKVAKQHVMLFIDQARQVPIIKALATGVQYNSRAELPANRPGVLSNGDTFLVGETIFQYEETE